MRYSCALVVWDGILELTCISTSSIRPAQFGEGKDLMRKRVPLVEMDKEADGLVRLGLEETKEGDSVRGTRLTIQFRGLLLNG